MSAGQIALVAAFEGELVRILDNLEDPVIHKVETINGVEFTHGSVYGKEFVAFMTGVSTVNAAMTTQLAIAHYDIEMLLFSGIAGGINPELSKGDVAIPAKWFAHGEQAYFNEDPKNPGTYVVPDYLALQGNNYGMMHPRIVSARRSGQTTPQEKPHFSADPDLLRVAASIDFDALGLQNSTGESALFKLGGNGVAGPVFMDNRDYREWVFDVWEADTLDMESTAIGHVCWSNNVPFLIIRSLSDLAGGQEGVNEIDEFGVRAETHASQVLNAVLKAL